MTTSFIFSVLLSKSGGLLQVRGRVHPETSWLGPGLFCFVGIATTMHQSSQEEWTFPEAVVFYLPWLQKTQEPPAPAPFSLAAI